MLVETSKTHELVLSYAETSTHKTLSDAANTHELVLAETLTLSDAATSNSHELTDAETSTHKTLGGPRPMRRFLMRRHFPTQRP